MHSVLISLHFSPKVKDSRASLDAHLIRGEAGLAMPVAKEAFDSGETEREAGVLDYVHETPYLGGDTHTRDSLHLLC